MKTPLVSKGEALEFDFIENHECFCLKKIDKNKNVRATSVICNSELSYPEIKKSIPNGMIDGYFIADLVSVSSQATNNQFLKDILLHLHMIGIPLRVIEELLDNNIRETVYSFDVKANSIGMPYVEALFLREPYTAELVTLVKEISTITGKQYIIRITLK